MRLLVISHKETWRHSQNASGFVTIGGFPFQMKAIAELFKHTTVMVPVRTTPTPSVATPLEGNNLQVQPLPEPAGRDLKRKLALIPWLLGNLQTVWEAVARSDALHTPVPGDIGAVGLIVALLQHKPLFVRHCGTWGEPVTLSDRLLLWLLQRIAGGQNVVMATGGGEAPPSEKNPHIRWIFSTTLTQRELDSLPRAKPWQPGKPLRMVTVGRLSQGKNTAAAIKAMPNILKKIEHVSLDVVGEGVSQGDLEKLARELGLSDRVYFHGNLPHEQVLETLSHSHLFLFPTRVKEGFPKALLEAMACGLPCIATRVSVTPHLLGNGCGVLVDDPSQDNVAQAVLAMIDEPKNMEQMGNKARHKAVEYSLEGWRDQIGERLGAAWGPLKSENARDKIATAQI